MLMCPASNLCYVGNEGLLRPAPRNELSERAVREYKEMAIAVAARPWNLQRAKDYITALVENNVSKAWPAPPELNYVLSNVPPDLQHKEDSFQ